MNGHAYLFILCLATAFIIVVVAVGGELYSELSGIRVLEQEQRDALVCLAHGDSRACVEYYS